MHYVNQFWRPRDAATVNQIHPYVGSLGWIEIKPNLIYGTYRVGTAASKQTVGFRMQRKAITKVRPRS